MTHILLLIAQHEAIEDGNYRLLGNELARRGFQVTCCFMDSISMQDSEIVAEGFDVSGPMESGAAYPLCQLVKLASADVIWTLTLGMRHSFLDKMQLLYCLKDHCQLINSPDALMHFKSKYFLASHSKLFQHPATYASTNPEFLMEKISAGGKWIAKPPAGSLGRDIFLLTKDDPNTRVILESMTGVEADQYCLLQSYVEEIAAGEKRVLFSNGVVVGQYMRKAAGDHRTNVMAGAAISLCELGDKERRYCEKIGTYLKDQGALFVGMDLAYPFVIEFNVVNPGGLTTLMELGAPNLAPRVIEALFPE